MPVRVFISYAREDSEIAKKVYFDLKKAGARPWLDMLDLLPGERWKPAIASAITNSTYFLALLSSSSVNKKGYVQRELRQALEILDEFPESGIFLIPVRLDECRPTSVRLAEINWVDLFPSYDEGIERIQRVLLRAEDPPNEPRDDAGAEPAEKTVAILLVRGENLEGASTFAYVAVRSDRIPDFMEAQAAGVFYPEDFGVIVESGEGEPSVEVQEMMEREYGFDHQGMIDIPDVETASSLAGSLGKLTDD